MRDVGTFEYTSVDRYKKCQVTFKKGMIFRETLENILSRKAKNVRDVLIYIVGDDGRAIWMANIKPVNLLYHLHPSGFYCPLSSDTI